MATLYHIHVSSAPHTVSLPPSVQMSLPPLLVLAVLAFAATIYETCTYTAFVMDVVLNVLIMQSFDVESYREACLENQDICVYSDEF